MKPTERLFYKDCLLTEFHATVLDCQKSDIGYRITLDKTLFFPESGGQPSDTGTLDNIEVLKVEECSDIIIHTTKKPLTVNSLVKGKIDMDFRYILMQHHTAEHIISGLIKKHYGYNNVGFHMGNEDVTMDFSGILTEHDLRSLELLANIAICKNLPIYQLFPSAKELEQIPYRSKKELEGDIRLIAIPYDLSIKQLFPESLSVLTASEISELFYSEKAFYDICACCAPHLKTTAEIGLVKLTSAEKYKGGSRIHMLCGFKALEDYNKKESEVSKISSMLSTKQYEVSAAVAKLREEINIKKSAITTLNMRLFSYKASEIEENTPFVCLFEKDLSSNDLRHYCNLVIPRCSQFCIIFTWDDHDFYKYIAASSSLDMTKFSKLINSSLTGRGGGSKEMIQGSVFANKDSILDFYEKAKLEFQI